VSFRLLSIWILQDGGALDLTGTLEISF